MAKKVDRKTAAQEFLKGILGKVPEDQRKAVEDALSVDALLEEIGDGVLRQSDYSRLSQEAQQAKDEYDAKQLKAVEVYNGNLEWLKGKQTELTDGTKALTELQKAQADLARLRKAVATGDPDDDDTETHRMAPTPDPKFMEELAAHKKALADTRTELDQVQKTGVQLMFIIDELSERHRDEFGVRLDRQGLLAYATKTGLYLDQAYDGFTSEARQVKTQKELEDKLVKARKEGEEAAISRFKSGPPYPLDASEGVSTFSGLKARKGGVVESPIDLAVADYNKGRAGV